MADTVCGPVFHNPAAKRPIEGTGGRPHKTGPAVVILFLDHIGSNIDQGAEYGLGLAILQGRIDAVGGVLFQYMDKGINKAVAQLFFRKRIGRLRIEDGKQRIDKRMTERQFFLRFFSSALSKKNNS